MNRSAQTLRLAMHTKILRAWTMACLAGVFAASAINILLYRLTLLAPHSLLGDFMSYYAHSGGPLLLNVAVLAFCQGVVVRKYFPRKQQAFSWLGAIALNTILSFFLYNLLMAYTPIAIGYTGLYALSTGLSWGLGAGIAQGLFFRSRVNHAIRWFWIVLSTHLFIAVVLHPLMALLQPSDPIFEALNGITTTSPVLSVTMSLVKTVLTILCLSAPTGWLFTRFVAEDKQRKALSTL
ncbi:MAG: hypothetical protein AAF703_04155 [Cyanobacteria bacterium P01_D01_bin.105]